MVRQRSLIITDVRFWKGYFWQMAFHLPSPNFRTPSLIHSLSSTVHFYKRAHKQCPVSTKSSFRVPLAENHIIPPMCVSSPLPSVLVMCRKGTGVLSTAHTTLNHSFVDVLVTSNRSAQLQQSAMWCTAAQEPAAFLQARLRVPSSIKAGTSSQATAAVRVSFTQTRC